MGKIRKGNKQNSFLNREYAAHMRADGKKFTSRIRRAIQKLIIKKELNEL